MLTAFHPDYPEPRMLREYQSCTQGRLKERYQAIILSYRGWSPPKIAEVVFKNTQTIREWIHQFNMEGLTGLDFADIPGRPRKLSAAQHSELKKPPTLSPRIRIQNKQLAL